MKLSEIIRSARAFTDVKQKELCAAVRISRQTCVSIERDGSYNPSFYLVMRILKYLKKKGAPEVSIWDIDIPPKDQ